MMVGYSEAGQLIKISHGRVTSLLWWKIYFSPIEWVGFTSTYNRDDDPWLASVYTGDEEVKPGGQEV